MVTAVAKARPCEVLDVYLLSRTLTPVKRARQARLALEALESRLAPAVVGIDAAVNVHAIDPNIYGSAFASTAQLADLHLPVNRNGGNASDTYSLAQDATNHASDWFFESIPLGSGNGQGMDAFISATKAGGAQPSVTLNLFDWAAKLGANRSNLGSFSVGKYGPQQAADPYNANWGNGVHTNGSNVTGNNAHDVLRDAGKPANLLIVVDKLDRLTPEVGQRLFHENGDLLKRLRAHVLYTVPIASVLAPINIGQVFEHKFTLPMVRVRDRKGKQSRKAVENLVEVLAARLDVPKLFARGVPQLLARMSGGSVRDLVRLAQSAQLVARGDGKEQIDRASAERAITKLRIDYQQLLIPGQIYYPLLAQVHQTKQDWFADVTQIDPAKVEGSRKFFNELLFNGAVMEYDGGQSWYDVHPVIEGIEAFEKAQSHVQSSPPAQE